MHQTFFCPPKFTLIKAINNKQFESWPGLTADAVRALRGTYAGRYHDAMVDSSKNYIDAFSKEGLRTLMLTKKDVSEREYNNWLVKWQAAERTLVEREEAIMKVSAEIETDMTLVGSTAIEDRLQEDV